MKKWNKKLGTSKREQGIITPRAPLNRNFIKEKVSIAEDILRLMARG